MMQFGGPSFSVADQCVLGFALSAAEGLAVDARVGHGSIGGYSLLALEGADLSREAAALYGGGQLRPRQGSDDETGSVSDALHRAVAISPPAAMERRDWIGALGRLADASGAAIYSDYYPDLATRAIPALPPRAAVAPALDALCATPAPSNARPGRSYRAGAPPPAPSGFWWRRGDAALARSRRWLWQSLTPLPAALCDRQIGALRRSGEAAPTLLPALAGLTFFQLQSLGPLVDQAPEWRRCLAVAARLSLPARQQALDQGVTWPDLSAGDRAIVSRLLGTAPGAAVPDFGARFKFQAQLVPGDQEAVISLVALEFRNPGWSIRAFARLPLPGVGAPPELAPRGLVVEQASPRGSR